jgi:SEC-C motif
MKYAVKPLDKQTGGLESLIGSSNQSRSVAMVGARPCGSSGRPCGLSGWLSGWFVNLLLLGVCAVWVWQTADDLAQPCPCGSGLNYKKCHASLGGPPTGKAASAMPNLQHVLEQMRRAMTTNVPVNQTSVALFCMAHTLVD